MIVKILKASQWCYGHNLNRCGHLFEKLMILVCGAHISGKAKIGKHVSFSHGGIGVIINPDAEIGDGCLILPRVTIGNRYPHPGVPKLGKNVYVGIRAYIGGGRFL